MLQCRFLALSVLIAACAVGLTAQRPLQAGLVSEAAFREALLAVLEDYPTDGTHDYHWPKSGGWAGVTRDLDYRGARVADGDPAGRCYCCGLTFELFFRAYESCCAAADQPFEIPGIADVKAVKALRKAWFGADGNRRTMQNAIGAAGLGRPIEDFESVRRGDFVQLWRSSGSGHSVVFLDWLREEGAIVGLRYWSTQKSTQGIGTRTERFARDGNKGVDPAQLYVARVGQPSGSFSLALQTDAVADLVITQGPAPDGGDEERLRWRAAGSICVGVASSRFEFARWRGPFEGAAGLRFSLRQKGRPRPGGGRNAADVLAASWPSEASRRSAFCRQLTAQVRAARRRPMLLVIFDCPDAAPEIDALVESNGLELLRSSGAAVLSAKFDHRVLGGAGGSTPFLLELVPQH